MTDPDLPRQLEEAGVISREQAERLHAIISRDNAEQMGVAEVGEPFAYQPPRG